MATYRTDDTTEINCGCEVRNGSDGQGRYVWCNDHEEARPPCPQCSGTGLFDQELGGGYVLTHSCPLCKGGGRQFPGDYDKWLKQGKSALTPVVEVKW